MLKHLLITASVAALGLTVSASGSQEHALALPKPVPDMQAPPAVKKAATPKYRADGTAKDAPVTISISSMSAADINATFTLINVKGCEWKVSEGFIYANTNEHTDDCDAWAISPKIHFKAGKSYYVYFNCASDADCRDIAELKYGTDNTVEAMTNTLKGATEYTSATHIPLGGTVKFDQDTDLYFGLHVITPKENAGGGFDFTSFAASQPQPEIPTPTVTPVEGGFQISWPQPKLKNF